MSNKFPLYRHYKLYECNQAYQKFKYISKNSYLKFEKMKRDMDLKKNNALSELTYDERYESNDYSDPMVWTEIPESCDAYSDDREWLDYSKRYKSLRECGFFYNNLKRIFAIVFSSESKEQFRITCTLSGIEEKFVNYAILYIANNPKRFMRYDYGYIFSNKRLKKIYSNILSNGDLKNIKTILMLNDLYAEIMENDMEVCSFKEFMNTPIYKE